MLVIQGTEDEYGTWRQVEAIQCLAGGPVAVVTMPGCGHAPHREYPDLILQAMARFISQLCGTGPL